jgi:hypothetical protein
MIQELGDNLIPVMAIGCTFLLFAIWVVLATIDSLFKTSCNSRLKQRLIERGASAQEIAQIIQAGQEEEEASDFTEPVPPVKAPHASYPVSSRVS